MERILSKFFTLQPTNDSERLTVCIYHDDTKPSLSINLEKNIFYCHACKQKGTIAELLAKVLNTSVEVVQFELKHLHLFPPCEDSANSGLTGSVLYHKQLLSDAKALDYLLEKRLWSLETIKALNIGLNNNRITIPVYNVFGDLVNIRSYRPGAKHDEPKMVNVKGHGKARIFNIRALQTGSDVLICEGEPDAIAAISAGFRAVSGTAGAGTFHNDWASIFRGTSVNVLYDTDGPGEEGSKQVASTLFNFSIPVKVIQIKPYLDGGKDLTDYFLQGGTAEDLKALLDATPQFTHIVEVQTQGEDQEIYDTTLSESSHERFYRKFVKIRVTVAGKTLAPYILPRRITGKCNNPGVKMCDGCTMHFKHGDGQHEFTKFSPEILELVESSHDSHDRIFKRLIGIPSKCSIVKFEIAEAQNVEEIKVPYLDFTTGDSEYVLRQVYSIGHGVKSNTDYEIVAFCLPHPRTQQVTYLTQDMRPLEDKLSQFQVTEDTIKMLRTFSVDYGSDTE
jgi:putative DNA primase/helicase